MKIHQISFKNINNLKGDHSIFFDQVPLSSAGIFAIVGPTGSGKSTILDVVTLALFNRIPRFKKAISKNEITNEGSVITHHTTEASASIDYEIKGQKYRSTWSVATNRNGKLKDYEMTFYYPDGSVADLKRSEVPAHNEKIIGLKYDQFIKSILLSQGEFSKFLKADRNERGELLENITGTSIYRKIGLKTYEKYKQVKEKLEREKEIIEVIPTIADEERKNLESELENSKIEKEKLDATLAALNDLKQVKTDVFIIKSNLIQKLKEEEDVKKQEVAFKQDYLKLEIHQKLSPIQGPFATYNDAVNNALKSQQNLKEYGLALKEAQDTHQRTIDDMSALTKFKVDEQSFKRIMNQFETEINNADRDLDNLKSNGASGRKRINQKKENYPINIDDNIPPDKAIELLTSREKELHILVSRAELNLNEPLENIKIKLKQSIEDAESLKEINALYSQINEVKLKLEAHQKAILKYIETEKNKTPLVEKCNKLIDSISVQIELLTKQKEDAIKIAELEDLRHALVTGSPCPLCGSTEHPYAEHKPDLQQSELEIKIQSAESELKTQRLELVSLQKELTECITSKDYTIKLISESSDKLAKVDKEIKQVISIFKGRSSIEHDEIKESIECLSRHNTSIEEAIEAVTELNFNSELREQYKQLQKYIEEYKTLKKERDLKFDGPDVNKITNNIQDAFETSKSKITEITAVIKKEEASLKRNSDLVISIADNLTPKIHQLGFSDIKDIGEHLLDEATTNKLTLKRDHLSSLKTSIETEIKTLRREEEFKLKLDTRKELALETIKETIVEQKASHNKHQNTFITNKTQLKRDDEDRARIKEKEEAIGALTKELEKWSLLNKMIGDATGNKFANFAQGLTLQNLLVYANRRLDSLSDRYLLDKPENDGSLVVVDKYQGNTSRSVTTLSGGESFLISLALALSLSDMASKNVALECLFIDEGFGTLDPDSLNSALDTLEKLQSESQKTVGVISHVEALKERIDVQVKLIKNPQGYSHIEIGNESQN